MEYAPVIVGGCCWERGDNHNNSIDSCAKDLSTNIIRIVLLKAYESHASATTIPAHAIRPWRNFSYFLTHPGTMNQWTGAGSFVASFCLMSNVIQGEREGRGEVVREGCGDMQYAWVDLSIGN